MNKPGFHDQGQTRNSHVTSVAKSAKTAPLRGDTPTRTPSTLGSQTGTSRPTPLTGSKPRAPGR